jgi:hypothetical protein
VKQIEKKLDRARYLARTLGWRTTLLYALSLVLNRSMPFLSVGKYLVVARPVTERRLYAGKRSDSIEILQFDSEHPFISALPRPPEEIARRFAGGAVCFLARRDNRTTGHLWVTMSSYCEPVHRCQFAPQPPGKVAWDFDMWISPEERMSPTFARLWDQCYSYLYKKGIRCTCSCVSAFNLAALQTNQRMGASELRKMYFFGIGPVELLYSTAMPRIALSLSRSTFPLVKVGVPVMSRQSFK